MTEEKPHGQVIIPKLIQDEMKQSYLSYSMSVIVGRALPDARDGLKPVHRRVLYAMHGLGLVHNKPYKKCARVVGEVLGKFHPHSDVAVFDALVRLAQNFSLRYPLIDGQGNFGSVDGDRSAAMRYVECRMTKLAEEMLEDIDKRTVKLVENFDNSTKEPSILPSKLPNLLINGSSGIAVGMATNIPPHNLREVADAVIKQVDNPDVSINELKDSIQGPDFPTGGVICGREGINNAYQTGRGKVILRAKTETEEVKERERIIITEIPYMVNKSEMIEEIARLVNAKRVEGVSDLRDESDKNGIRVVIELKKDADKDLVLTQLFRHSRMQVTFGVIMLALVDNVPKVLNIKQMIHYFIDHRKDVIRKRTLFDLNKAQDRAHILEGILIALDNIDKVIETIKKSDSVEIAKKSLMTNYTLTEEQSVAILEMRLQRLTSLEQNKVKKEHADLIKLIEELKSILEVPEKIPNIIKQEMVELKEKYGDDRRSEIINEMPGEVVAEDLIKKEDMVVTVTHSGYIKRLPIETYKIQGRGGKGVKGAATREEDVIKDVFIANTHNYMLFFTNKGKVHWMKVHQIPEASRIGKGKAIINLLHLAEGEVVTAFVPVEKFDEEHNLILVTKKGTIKRTRLDNFKNPRKTGIIAITLSEGDDLINVELTDNKKQIILATKKGNAIRFKEEGVRSSGRSSQGVKGINLKGDDEVIGMVVAEGSETLLTITENGFGKRTDVEEYRLIGRGGSGVINIKCSERNGNVVSICSIKDEEDVIFISKNGIIIRMNASNISKIGRATQGVRLMKLGEGDKVVSATVTKE